MSIQLTRVHESSPNTTWVKVEVSGPIDAKLTQDEAEQTVKALVMAHQLAADEPPHKRHLIERVLLRMGMELEGLDALGRT